MQWLLSLSRRNQIIIGALVLVTLIISIAATIVVRGRAHSQPEGDELHPAVLSARTDGLDLSTPSEDLSTLTVLLLGYGGPGHQGGMLADVIQLIHIDIEQQRVTAISIPRDLWVALPSGEAGKINMALTLGSDPSQPVVSGGQVAKQMASVVTGLPVDYVIAVDFVGFQRLVGEVFDGIEVEVAETLDDPWYPIKGEEVNPCGHSPEEIAELTATYSGFELEKQFPCRYEHIYYQPGTHTMHGHEALAYVRSRHGSAGGDFSRSQRQHEVLGAFLKKVISLDGIRQAPQLYEQAAYTFQTDLDIGILNYLVPAIQHIGTYEQQTVVLSTQNVFTTGKSSSGQFIVVPKAGVGNWDQTHAFVADQVQ